MQSLPGIPEIQSGDSLADIIAQTIIGHVPEPEDGDILVLAHKIVSKAEGRLFDLSKVTPSERAIELAREIRKDPAKVELILRESSEIIRIKPPRDNRESVVICRHRLGFIMANAGVDESNVAGGALLLPVDPDASARALCDAWRKRFNARIGVIITDSFGRPWRQGLVNIAIGIARVPALVDLTGTSDHHGRILQATIPAFADEVAAASGLLMHKAGRTPVVLVRGLHWRDTDDRATDIRRPDKEDMFR